ncbi:MAG TPA: FAD-dependent oxidoreductase [Chitinophaga sp.]|uniref:FAD-dependent oxidoreductase n=1 Tax=Chitinophaga sp. TaxID=1869181 RepID=UPI002F950E67
MITRKCAPLKAGCLLLVTLLFLIPAQPLAAQQANSYDICIYGGTAAGVIAAYTAKKMGKTVLLVEPGSHLGGMTSGGLGMTDIGNKYAITGLGRNFYRRIGRYYGKFEQWIFEPHVAEALINSYIQSAEVPVLYRYYLTRATMQQGSIQSINLIKVDCNNDSIKTITAKVFIDCTYEGDLMAKAGVSYTVGREANTQYQETYNGVQLRDKHQFADSIDPYRTPGQPESGLLWGISPAPLAAPGSGDAKVQAYNFRICLTNVAANMIPITRPDNYDSTRYELALRSMAKTPWTSLMGGLKVDAMPNNKTDINNNGPFSTDMIGMNYDYAQADYMTRRQIFKMHEDYTKGWLYFLGHDPRVQANIRPLMLKWGYPKDEYTDNGNWTFQLYIREARRMVSAYVMTQANCEGRVKVTDGIGLGAYSMDSHNCQRIVVNGMVKNEGDVQVGVLNPYAISYRSIVPKAAECRNLLVPVCLSATHIAYGSIRMEPVFMVLGQSAAVAAVQAIDSQLAIQDIDVSAVQQKLKQDPLADGSIPEVQVDDADTAYVRTTGTWQRLRSANQYATSILLSVAPGSAASSVRFNPPMQFNGRYTIYYYNLARANKAPTAAFTIAAANGLQTVTPSLVENGNEWISLGTYEYSSGSPFYVSIALPAGVQGDLLADALLFVPE